MSKYTKIVATVSDLRCDVDFIKALYENGMNVVRMNSAHINEEGFTRIISNTRAVSNKIPILMDTKGPELRTTTIENEGRINFVTGDIVRFVGNADVMTTKDQIAVNYPDFVKDLHVGGIILIDDGEIEFKVTEKHDDYLVTVAENNGELGARKSVNVPGVRISLPSLTEKDKKNILFGIKIDIDFTAHSFVRSKQDILDIHKILAENNSKINIFTKIDKQ